MKRTGFIRPTVYYDERISTIDEQLCHLIRKRKELSYNNPGFPPDKNISKWAKQFDLYEDLLRSIFGTLRMDDDFKPRVEPHNFIKHIPILKSVEIGVNLYTVTFIRQFENASVVQLDINWDGTNDSHEDLHNHPTFEMNIGEQYDCRWNGGRGGTGRYSQEFIVSPPIPDNPSGLTFIFKEYSSLFKDKPTGVEVKIYLE
ncbi:hypothetical protein [Cytobacillus massiliigabonensis]|uniref:hypothetical protein n=1 Tax=Cytobacillus massiliigabonensis TaxID=1871011 RepID=UPI000C831D6D|nr:hypothetical protein [Cytobacillus massiliigabonensis]